MHRSIVRDRAVPRRSPTHLLTAIIALAIAAPSSADDFFAGDRDAILDALSTPPDDGGAVSRSFFKGEGGPDTVSTVRVMHEGEVEGTRAIAVVERRNGAPSVNLRVEFALDSAELDPDSRALLGELGAALKAPALDGEPVSINGHTDSSGAENYNLELSYRRAESVRAYLAGELGIEAERLDVLGFGESVPLNANATEAERAVNRRVEIERIR